MHINQLPNIQRREFLRRSAALGITGAAGPLALSLSAMGEAAAAAATDYKALVCIFLYGGNDHDNTVIPFDDASHLIYGRFRNVGPEEEKASRIYWDKTATAPSKKLIPFSTLIGTRQYAVQPAMSNLASLFESANMGVLLNVGPLGVPTTKQQYDAKSVSLPPKLFSHNDQFSLWQSGTLNGAEGSTKGWGGRMGDIFLRGNNTDSAAHFTAINASGNAVFMSGIDIMPYQVSTSGPVAISSVGLGNSISVYGRASCKTAFNDLLKNAPTPSHWMEKEWMRVLKSSMDNQATVTSSITPEVSFTTAFKTDPLSSQLKIIARLIGAASASSSSMGVKRQVFFASLGGFDLHDNLMANHTGLLQKVNDSMYSFYKATEQLGITNQVTTFTASDFGRTLASNGDGSDHGWGSHHMVMGGAVAGKQFWGKAPTLAENGPDTVGQGRLLPSTSVDEFAASLARWMGVSNTDLATVLPNLKTFEQASGRSRLALFAA
jgi:uncharacterized protein (DUF1501 family)